MVKLFFLLLLILINVNVATAQPSMKNTETLKSDIELLFDATPGTFALAFKDLSAADHQLLINEREAFHAASTMKTPVMIEVYRQAAAGRFSLQDSLLVKNEFKSIVDGSPYSMEIGRDDGEHLYDNIGKKRSVKELVVDMIIYSSNLATNIVIELVGADEVNKTMRSLGANDIQVLRGVEDMKAYDAGLNNSTTAYDLMRIFEALAREEVVSKKDSQEMVEILLQQTHKDVIPVLLPAAVKVANKTGFISGVHHDSAIVYLPDGRKYVLVLLSKQLQDAEAGKKMLSQVSRLVYDHMMKKHSY
ncbi:serine hydrolase [Cesiribacter sp. SM1]|uniref:serine hydrolase n=1 Tax=Cesiribacter sp. SM1 TaxID=2861196 RepID=UPI001CD1C116|nr:serine hydrolase [Cesiribacter sp. SM1]